MHALYRTEIENHMKTHRNHLPSHGHGLSLSTLFSIAGPLGCDWFHPALMGAAVPAGTPLAPSKAGHVRDLPGMARNDAEPSAATTLGLGGMAPYSQVAGDFHLQRARREIKRAY